MNNMTVDLMALIDSAVDRAVERIKGKRLTVESKTWKKHERKEEVKQWRKTGKTK